MKKREVRRSCFTLLEMIVVIVIIALIASIVGPDVYKKLAQASAKQTKAQVKALANAVIDYQLDVGSLPPTGNLEALVSNTSGSEKWDGPYLNTNTLPKDPWGEDYIYNVPGQGRAYEIISYGADKQPGGEKDAADISNWD